MKPEERSEERILKTPTPVVEKRWDRETPIRAYSTPYTFSEILFWIWNNIFGPSSKNQELTKFIPSKISLNPISPKLRIGFLGDIMKLNQRDVSIGADMRRFFSDADFLVGNFEGVIGNNAKQALIAQCHSEKILTILAGFFPPTRTILSCANNHACDYGWKNFSHSYHLLQDYGFHTIGRADEPSLLIDGKISISSCTSWSNQRCTYVSRCERIEDYYNREAEFNILYPHWGYEMQLYPDLSQVRLARELCTKWDMVVGHHSHCPQPVTTENVNNRRKLIAYSLGNFMCSLHLKKYMSGLVLKVDLGPGDDGRWLAGEIQWSFTSIRLSGKSSVVIELMKKSPYFDFTC
jgi:hypothetical protein